MIPFAPQLPLPETPAASALTRSALVLRGFLPAGAASHRGRLPGALVLVGEAC